MLGEAQESSYSPLKILRMIRFSGDCGGRQEEVRAAAHTMQSSGRRIDCLGPAPGDMWPLMRANAKVTNDRRKEKV
jgi:hypothetical protein